MALSLQPAALLPQGIPRLTPGALRLRLRQKFGHGLTVAYYRDIVRPRILRQPAVADTTDRTCEIHVLTSKSDWLNLMWTLKSFYAVSSKRYALCIHADRTLPSEAAAEFQKHFPAGQVISREEADAKAARILKEFPRCMAFRRSNPLAPKVLDFLMYLQSDRMALFDSDLLFFSEPVAYLKRIEDPGFLRNTFNSDCGASAYTVTSEVSRRHAGVDLHPMVNSGLGLVHRASMRFEWLEEFLALPGITEGHFWRIEQTLFALCSSRYGTELLPEEYTLQLGPGIGGRPFRHYVGQIRHLMYGEGMRELVRRQFLAPAPGSSAVERLQ